MSVCPDCQQETGESNFCRGCFRSLQPGAPGRFASLLEQGFHEPPPASQWAGPDLLAVTFQQPPRRGAMFVKSRQLAGAALALAACAAAFQFYQHQNYRQALQHRLNGVALTRQGDFEGAHRQLAEAPDEPDSYRARAELAVAEGNWQEAAEQFRKISVDDSDVNAHLDAAALEQAQALMKQARQSHDTARALSLSDQAESLLDEHHAKPQQRAEVHLLRALLFGQLELRQEQLQELQLALQLDPSQTAARQKLAQLTPPPVLNNRLPLNRPAARKAIPPVDIPRMQTQPDYPTYQPPVDEFGEELKSSDGSSVRSGPNGKRRSP